MDCPSVEYAYVSQSTSTEPSCGTTIRSLARRKSVASTVIGIDVPGRAQTPWMHS